MNITQIELASKLYISSKQVSKYEKGELFPPLETMIKLCSIFKCEIGYLLGEPQYKNGTQLNTAISQKLGFSSETIGNIEKINGSGKESLSFGNDSETYKRILNSYLAAHNFTLLIEKIRVLDEFEKQRVSIWKPLTDKFGEDAVHEALKHYSEPFNYEDKPESHFKSNQAFEAYLQIDDIIDRQQEIEYGIKIARYELNEVFNALINELYPTPTNK